MCVCSNVLQSFFLIFVVVVVADYWWIMIINGLINQYINFISDLISSISVCICDW